MLLWFLLHAFLGPGREPCGRGRAKHSNVVQVWHGERAPPADQMHIFVTSCEVSDLLRTTMSCGVTVLGPNPIHIRHLIVPGRGA